MGRYNYKKAKRFVRNETHAQNGNDKIPAFLQECWDSFVTVTPYEMQTPLKFNIFVGNANERLASRMDITISMTGNFFKRASGGR